MTNDALTQLFSDWGPVYMARDADLLISNLRAELATAQSECLEQARLNGMGSEREAALMAKLEAERAKVVAWQPIVSAPKDGTEIFAWWGPWTLESGAKVTSSAFGTTLWESGEWVNPDEHDDHYRTPTHWMPLPPPPIDAAQDEGERA